MRRSTWIVEENNVTAQREDNTRLTAPALAMGNTVVLKPATVTRLSALLFAEICAEAGLPPGVFNVVTGGGAMGQTLAEHPDVDKIGFTGSTEIGKVLRQAIAGTGKKISLELGGKRK